MRYLINLLLLGALFGLWWEIKFRLLSDRSGLEASVAVVVGTIFCWVTLTAALAGCVMTGGFDWLPISGRGGTFAAVLGAFAVLVFLSLTPISIAMESAESSQRWGTSTIILARLVAVGIPVVLIAYAACLANFPLAWPATALWQYGVLAVLVALGVIAGLVTLGEMQRQQAVTAANQHADEQAADTRGQEQRQAMQALSDADPLIQWDQFVGANVPDDVRVEALRRIAARPTLETDLTAALTNPNTLWSNEAIWLMLQLDFTPSAKLEAPIRTAFSNVTAGLRDKTNDTANDGDRYVDLYQAPQLDRILQIAELMAAKAHVDLSDALDPVQQAVVEIYPTSTAAKTWPAAVADTKRQIKAALAASK